MSAKPVAAHVLFIPSWYATRDNPVHGSFFRDQALAVAKLGVQTGVVYTELRSLRSLPADGAREMFRRRYRVTEADDNGVSTMRVEGWLIPQAKRLSRQLWVQQTQRLVRSYARRHGVPDVIHAHCVHNAGVAAMEAKRRFRIPFVVTEHFSGYARGLLSDALLVQAREVFTEADRIIAVSHALSQQIQRYAGGKAIGVIPNLVDTEFFSPPPEARRTRPFTFLFVGFLTDNKGVEELLRAFAVAFGADDSVRLEIGGDGVHRPVLEAVARDLGLGNRVRFLGLLSREQVRAALWRANAFVSASRVETFGVVLIEAMATGIPVIVTRCGGPEEIVTTELGRLVPAGDGEALQLAMSQMNSRCEEWHAAAPRIRDHVERNFSAGRVGRRLLEVYESVIGQA